MTKERKSVRAAAGDTPPPKTIDLTWKEERFVYAYIENGGNAAHASREAGHPPHTSRQQGQYYLSKPYIRDAIELEQERMRALVQFSRDRALRILVGQATARMSDFQRVLQDPDNEGSYVNLAEKEYALEMVESSPKTGNKIKIISNSERRAIINDLWTKLGFDKEGSTEDRESFLERFARFGSRLGRVGNDGGSNGGEGST